MAKNEWEKQFGAIRRAKDKKLLAELEKQIAQEERDKAGIHVAVDNSIDRAAIAKAFGRPLTS